MRSVPLSRQTRNRRVAALLLSVLPAIALLAGLYNSALSEQASQATAAPRLGEIPAQQVLPAQSAPMAVSYVSRDARHTQSVAWGDVDGDGDLDLAVGNGLYPQQLWLRAEDYNLFNQVYFNNGNGQFVARNIGDNPLMNALDTRRVAWGDWDGDGDLDLAVANGGEWGGPQPNQVYENEGGVLKLAPEEGLGWISPDKKLSSSLAWGDWDGDGDLDLAVGNDGRPWCFERRPGQPPVCFGSLGGEVNQVFENISGTLQLDPAQGIGWESADLMPTADLAWGDWDGDGDLDLAAGNYGQPDQIYENTGGDLGFNPAQGLGWQADASRLTQAAAWGDWNGDGRLDLAVGGGDRGNAPGHFLLVYQYDPEAQTLRLDPAAGIGWQEVSESEKFKPASLAWGDWDGDGDLDLAAGVNAGGGWGNRNRIYENQAGALRLDTANNLGWESPLKPGLNAETTYAIALGDGDGDGDLDLAVGNGGLENGGQTNFVFRNQSPAIAFATDPWESAEALPSTSVAWGDWDGDGDLDLAVGNDGEPNQVYENEAGVLQWDPAAGAGWQAPLTDTASTADVAWGDWDGDGDLDLAVGNDGAPDRVYENDGSSLLLAPIDGLGWQSPITDTGPTRAVAWGDWDRDGDLDLALARRGDVAQVWENEAGTLRFDPASGLGWESPELLTAEGAAWGDWDDDGDLDLALGARVYENVDDMLLFDVQKGFGWDGGLEATDVAWGDMDGDGLLDLAVGTFARNRVYRNTGGALAFDPREGIGWESFDVMRTRAVAWGDADGDGRLDLAAANGANWGFEPNQVFQNARGLLTPLPAWESADTRAAAGFRQKSHDVAWGDVDGDGDLDLAVANYCTENECDAPGRVNQVYINTLQQPAEALPAVVAPFLTVSDPDNTNPADFYASPEIVSGEIISIPYRIVDPTEAPVGRLEVFYSVDGGDNWKPARPTAGTRTTNLAASRAGVEHVFGWDTFASGFFGLSDNVAIRMIAYKAPPNLQAAEDGTYRYFNGVSGSFQRPRVSATTFPFRVVSTLIQVVDEAGRPLRDAVVFRLPEDRIEGATLMPDPARPQATNADGFLVGGGELNRNDRLTAMHGGITNPVTFTNKVRLFYTSARPITAGLDMAQFDKPGVVSLTVSDENPLLLFDLDVALEWDARSDPTFLAELAASFQRASEILYDVTNGQAAIGTVLVFQGKEYWPQADVVIYANNSLRPSAAIGGVARIPLSDTVRVGLTGTKTISNAYGGGQIRMGTVWDPFGENTAELGEDWWRALAHELAHYLLFLPDNYLGFGEEGILSRINCRDSFMTSTYDPAYSEFLTEQEWVDACRNSLAEVTTGRTDWETIRRFYPMLREPAAEQSPFEGPLAQPLGLTSVYFWPPQETRAALRARNFDVRDRSRERLRLPSAQAYLFQSQGTADPTDDMLVLLGAPTGGGDRLKVRGAFPGDRLCLIDTTAGQSYIGCDGNLQATDVAINLSPLDEAWRPEIAVNPVTSRTLQISVTQALSDGEQLNVQVFPLHYWSLPNQAGLSPTATLQTTGDLHTGTLTMALPAYEVAVRVWTPGEPPREAVSQLGLNPPWPQTPVDPNALASINPLYLRVGGPNNTGIGGPNNTGIGGPNNTGIGGPNYTGIGGPNNTGIGGPNNTGIGGPNNTGIGGPNNTGIGGPNNTGIGGPNNTGIGGPNNTGIGGPNNTGIGGPNNTGIGGADSQSFHAPIRSADAQVVVYSKEGFFEDNGVDTLHVLGRVPQQETHPWLSPVGQAYHVALRPEVVSPRFIAFNYLQRDVPEGFEHTLTVYFLPDGETTWRRLPTQRFVENMVVADLQPQDGVYAVMSTVEMPALQPGWNLFVYPLAASQSVSSTLASIDGSYTAVIPYSPNDPAGPSAVPPAADLPAPPDFEFGRGYWIWIQGDETVTPYLAPPRRSPGGVVPGS